jgi:hypothetical protein
MRHFSLLKDIAAHLCRPSKPWSIDFSCARFATWTALLQAFFMLLKKQAHDFFLYTYAVSAPFSVPLSAPFFTQYKFYAANIVNTVDTVYTRAHRRKIKNE